MKYCNKTLRYGKIRRILYQEGLVIVSVFAPKTKKKDKSFSTFQVSTLSSPCFPPACINSCLPGKYLHPHTLCFTLFRSRVLFCICVPK